MRRGRDLGTRGGRGRDWVSTDGEVKVRRGDMHVNKTSREISVQVALLTGVTMDDFRSIQKFNTWSFVSPSSDMMLMLELNGGIATECLVVEWPEIEYQAGELEYLELRALSLRSCQKEEVAEHGGDLAMEGYSSECIWEICKRSSPEELLLANETNLSPRWKEEQCHK